VLVLSDCQSSSIVAVVIVRERLIIVEIDGKQLGLGDPIETVPDQATLRARVLLARKMQPQRGKYQPRSIGSLGILVVLVVPDDARNEVDEQKRGLHLLPAIDRFSIAASVKPPPN